jgi:mannobiose 2-epimerase
MHERFGATDPRYFQAFEGTWKFCLAHQIDPKHGGWFGEVSPDGSKVLTTEKGNNWKEPYHTARALLNSIDLLKKQEDRPQQP